MPVIETKPRSGLRMFVVIVAALYAGLLLGVSFIATPAKFMATSLTLPVGMDVGQVTFHALAVAEWILGALLIVTAIFARVTKTMYVFIAAIAVMRLLEDLWLLPILDQRVAAIIAGGTKPAGPHHTIYAVFDVLKLILLLLVTWLGSRRAKQAVVA